MSQLVLFPPDSPEANSYSMMLPEGSDHGTSLPNNFTHFPSSTTESPNLWAPAYVISASFPAKPTTISSLCPARLITIPISQSSPSSLNIIIFYSNATTNSHKHSLGVLWYSNCKRMACLLLKIKKKLRNNIEITTYNPNTYCYLLTSINWISTMCKEQDRARYRGSRNS